MSNLSELLLYAPIFSDLPEESVAQIAQIGVKKSFKKDEIILLEEDTGGTFFVIISGNVKVSRTNGDSKEVILGILNEFDFFGEMALLDGLTRSATISAINDTELFMIQRNQFLELLKDNPEISIVLMQELTKRLRTANMQIKSFSLKDAEGKVATVLIQLAYDLGRIKQGVVEIEKLPMQQDLANMASTSRETVSRTLHTFAKKGLVELDGSKIRILDYEKFKKTYE